MKRINRGQKSNKIYKSPEKIIKGKKEKGILKNFNQE